MPFPGLFPFQTFENQFHGGLTDRILWLFHRSDRRIRVWTETEIVMSADEKILPGIASDFPDRPCGAECGGIGHTEQTVAGTSRPEEILHDFIRIPFIVLSAGNIS